MTLRSLPRPVKIAGGLTITGLALYAITQSRSHNATATNPPGVFSQWGPKSFRGGSVDTVNHNTKRLVFEFPDAQARSGLSLTCAYFFSDLYLPKCGVDWRFVF